MTSMTSPGSPSRRDKEIIERDRILIDLSQRWGLELQPPKDGDSPAKRQEKLAVTRGSATERYTAFADRCTFTIGFLCFKDKTALSSALERFEQDATALQSSWVYMPHVDEDVLRRSARRSDLSATVTQREQLLQCLLQFLEPALEQAKERQRFLTGGRTPSRSTSLCDAPHAVITPPQVSNANRSFNGSPLDETPIPFSLGAKGRGKRPYDGDADLNDCFKRPRAPVTNDSASVKVLDIVDNVPVTTRQTRSGTRLNFGTCKTSWQSGALSASNGLRDSHSPVNPPSDIGRQWRGTTGTNTTNTSFTSAYTANSSFTGVTTANTSFTGVNTGDTSFTGANTANTSFNTHLSSAFSDKPSDETFFSTRTSVMDVVLDKTGTQNNSSQYGSSIDYKARNNVFSRPVDEAMGVRIDKTEVRETSTIYGSTMDGKEVEEAFGHPLANLMDVSLEHTEAPEISSYYGSSVDYKELEHYFRRPPEELLRERLQRVFRK